MNKVLEDSARAHQLELAAVQSATASYSISNQSPFHRCIHLGANWEDRQATLAMLKDQTLRDAERYNSQRTRFLSVTQKYVTIEKFTLPSGDFCIVNFEICPLDGISSVKQVYDALRFFYFNLDISLTESSGDLVVREQKNDSSLAADASHQRFLRTGIGGLEIESNQVMFSEYHAQDYENGFGREFAVIAVTSVDKDDLFPYKPDERLRHDLAATATLKTYPRKVGHADAVLNEEFEVVLVRSYFMKVHQSNLATPSEVFSKAEFAAELCSKEIFRTVSSIVHAFD